MLKKPAEELGLRKLNFQMLCRTIAALAQTRGNDAEAGRSLVNLVRFGTAGIWVARK